MQKVHDEIAIAENYLKPTKILARPFIKWAGGKGALLGTLTEFVPAEFGTYFEPFLGGGAFFFHLSPENAVLADANPELINCFHVVQEEPARLISSLRTFRNSEEDFYRVRGQNPARLSAITRAARFIYLNKTCFNGLYRVNRGGEFNTPYGNNPAANFVDEGVIHAASAALQGALLRRCDFKEAVKDAGQGDFVYFDPPYLPVSEFSDFKRYTPHQFREPEHEELASLFRQLDARGCYLLLSNSFHPKIEKLYRGFHQVIVTAPRFINCRGNRRGHVNELLISNF